MADDNTDTADEAVEAVAEETPDAEAAVEEAPAEEAAAPVAEAEEAAEPVAEAEEAAEEVPSVESEYEDGEAAPEYEADAAPVAVATQAPSVARVFICKHGHRTVSLWSTPESCLRRVKGHLCGESVVPLADAPADAKEKMLNPLKASKKAAKKS